MIVAWQFTARECVLKKIRPVGCGLTWSTSRFTTQGRRTFPPTQSYRSLSGRFGFFRIPGGKLPGYYHLVPSGQKTPGRFVCIFDATSPQRFDDSLPVEASRSLSDWAKSGGRVRKLSVEHLLQDGTENRPDMSGQFSISITYPRNRRGRIEGAIQRTAVRRF